ncbi:hypothetical protein FZEAL_10154 [Fusarium zealandicum]|uniref:Rhodopsin domain-containing protein n=1 Tax=Fusarium zealandicum TaxID=1053134 RepID=A0A8H4XCD7_9HYPO|nr:hypothetical protein FZEAL_10154 [Fusarium zealandicum]
MSLTESLPPPSGEAVLGIGFTLIAIAAGILGARMYLLSKVQGLRFDTGDYLRILAWCSGVAYLSFNVLYFVNGVLGPDISIALDHDGLDKRTVAYIYQMTWASMIPFYSTLYLCKGSILATYLKLFPDDMAKRRVMLLVTVGFCAVSYVSTMGVKLLSCLPFETNWSSKGCHVQWQANAFQFAWVLHFFSTLILIVIPFTALHETHTGKKAKIAVFCLFLISLVEVAVSVIRFLNIYSGSGNEFKSFTTIELWSGLDVYLGLIVAFLLSLHPCVEPSSSPADEYAIDDSEKSARSSSSLDLVKFEEVEELTCLGDSGVDTSGRISHFSSTSQDTMYESYWTGDEDEDEEDPKAKVENVKDHAPTKDQAHKYWSNP